MNQKKTFWMTALTLLWFGFPASAASGQIAAPEILAGLTTAHTMVSYFEDGSPKSSGSEARQLASDLERQLAETGLKLVSRDEFDRLIASRGYPAGLVDLEVRTGKISGMDIKTYYVGLRLKQVAYVARKPVLRFMAATWDYVDTGTADDFNAVRGRVRGAVARFVADYLAENPK